jgi:transcriptional regulator with XRE-family HTH domain
VATRLGAPQSYVSKYESGERKLDLAEAHGVCAALGTTLTDFAALFERELDQSA